MSDLDFDWDAPGFGAEDSGALGSVGRVGSGNELEQYAPGEHPAIVKFEKGLDGAVLQTFWDDEWKRRTLIVGPVGSAKTTTAIWKLVKICEESPIDPDPEVLRGEFHGYVIRAEKNKLHQVAKDFSEVFQKCGWSNTDVRTLPSGGWGIEPYKEFLDLDGELRTISGDVIFTGTRGSGKSDSSITGGALTGFNLSWVYVNECREVSDADVHSFGSRCRGPEYGVKHGQWHGVVMDTNPAGKRSWTTDRLNDKRKGRLDPNFIWEVYDQPPAAFRTPDGNYIENPEVGEQGAFATWLLLGHGA